MPPHRQREANGTGARLVSSHRHQGRLTASKDHRRKPQFSTGYAGYHHTRLTREAANTREAPCVRSIFLSQY